MSRPVTDTSCQNGQLVDVQLIVTLSHSTNQKGLLSDTGSCR